MDKKEVEKIRDTVPLSTSRSIKTLNLCRWCRERGWRGGREGGGEGCPGQGPNQAPQGGQANGADQGILFILFGNSFPVSPISLKQLVLQNNPPYPVFEEDVESLYVTYHNVTIYVTYSYILVCDYNCGQINYSFLFV